MFLVLSRAALVSQSTLAAEVDRPSQPLRDKMLHHTCVEGSVRPVAEAYRTRVACDRILVAFCLRVTHTLLLHYRFLVSTTTQLLQLHLLYNYTIFLSFSYEDCDCRERNRSIG